MCVSSCPGPPVSISQPSLPLEPQRGTRSQTLTKEATDAVSGVPWGSGASKPRDVRPQACSSSLSRAGLTGQLSSLSGPSRSAVLAASPFCGPFIGGRVRPKDVRPAAPLPSCTAAAGASVPGGEPAGVPCSTDTTPAPRAGPARPGSTASGTREGAWAGVFSAAFPAATRRPEAQSVGAPPSARTSTQKTRARVWKARGRALGSCLLQPSPPGKRRAPMHASAQPPVQGQGKPTRVCRQHLLCGSGRQGSCCRPRSTAQLWGSKAQGTAWSPGGGQAGHQRVSDPVSRRTAQSRCRSASPFCPRLSLQCPPPALGTGCPHTWGAALLRPKGERERGRTRRASRRPKLDA